MVSLTNATEPAVFGPTSILCWSITYGIVGTVVIASNALVLTVFTRLPSPKKKHVHLLLINLSVTDFIVGGITIPLLIWRENIQAIGTPYSRIWSSFEMFNWTSVFESAFSIVLISIDRLHAVGRPLRHRVLTIRPYIIAILFTWFFAIVLSVLMTFARILQLSYITFCNVMVASLTVPLVITATAYTALWAVKNNSQNSNVLIRSNLNHCQDKRLLRTLFTVTVVFFATCSPFVIIKAVHVYAHVSVSGHIYAFARLLQYSNSFCNSVIYWFTEPVFLMVLREIVWKSFCHSNISSRSPALGIELARRCSGSKEGFIL